VKCIKNDVMKSLVTSLWVDSELGGYLQTVAKLSRQW